MRRKEVERSNFFTPSWRREQTNLYTASDDIWHVSVNHERTLARQIWPSFIGKRGGHMTRLKYNISWRRQFRCRAEMTIYTDQTKMWRGTIHHKFTLMTNLSDGGRGWEGPQSWTFGNIAFFYFHSLHRILCYLAEEAEGDNERGGERTLERIWSKEAAACHKPQSGRRLELVETIHPAPAWDSDLLRQDKRSNSAMLTVYS